MRSSVSGSRRIVEHVGPPMDEALILDQPRASTRHRSLIGRGRYGTGFAGSDT